MWQGGTRKAPSSRLAARVHYQFYQLGASRGAHARVYLQPGGTEGFHWGMLQRLPSSPFPKEERARKNNMQQNGHSIGLQSGEE